jgi:hypothetical protein
MGSRVAALAASSCVCLAKHSVLVSLHFLSLIHASELDFIHGEGTVDVQALVCEKYIERMPRNIVTYCARGSENFSTKM